MLPGAFGFLGPLVYTSCMLRVAFLPPSFNIIFLCLSIKKKIPGEEVEESLKGCSFVLALDFMKGKE